MPNWVVGQDMDVRKPAIFWTFTQVAEEWCGPDDLASADAGAMGAEASAAVGETSAEASAAAAATSTAGDAGANSATDGGASAASVGGVAGAGSAADGEASVGAGTACSSPFSAGATAIAETDVCIFGASTTIMKFDVNDIVSKVVATNATEVQPFPGIGRGDNPETNLSWLVCGADRLSATSMPTTGSSCRRRRCRRRFTECLLQTGTTPWCCASSLSSATWVAMDEGRLPLGVILGYMAITGAPAAHHSYQDSFGNETCYILPKDKADGTSMLPDIVKTGGQLRDKGNDETLNSLVLLF